MSLEDMVGGKHNAWCHKKVIAMTLLCMRGYLTFSQYAWQGAYFEVDGAEDVFYHDVPAEKQAKAVAVLKPHACK